MINLKTIHNANLIKILSSIGDSVSYNGFNTYGYLNREPVDVLQMNNKQYAVNDTTLTLIIAANSIGTITNRTAITVDNKNYEIDHFIPLSNGQEIKLWLTGV